MFKTIPLGCLLWAAACMVAGTVAPMTTAQDIESRIEGPATSRLSPSPVRLPRIGAVAHPMHVVVPEPPLMPPSEDHLVPPPPEGHAAIEDKAYDFTPAAAVPYTRPYTLPDTLRDTTRKSVPDMAAS